MNVRLLIYIGCMKSRQGPWRSLNNGWGVGSISMALSHSTSELRPHEVWSPLHKPLRIDNLPFPGRAVGEKHTKV
jgi:hypothetical protein